MTYNHLPWGSMGINGSQKDDNLARPLHVLRDGEIGTGLCGVSIAATSLVSSGGGLKFNKFLKKSR